jgi:hypothetical protein
MPTKPSYRSVSIGVVSVKRDTLVTQRTCSSAMSNGAPCGACERASIYAGSIERSVDRT